MKIGNLNINKRQVFINIKDWIKVPSPTILNKRKEMKVNTYFHFQKNLVNSLKNCHDIERTLPGITGGKNIEIKNKEIKRNNI